MPLPKKPSSPANRQPQGVPVGGQFAPNTHAEPDVTLSQRKPFAFTEEDNDPHILDNAPSTDGGPVGGGLPRRPAGSGGSGALPPLPPTGGGSSSSSDDAEREGSIGLMSSAARKHAAQLVNRGARTINISARENNGTLRFDDVLDRNGRSIDDEYGTLAASLTGDVNANRVGGGIPAEQILGSQKSAAIDAVALFDGRLEIVGPGNPPRLG